MDITRINHFGFTSNPDSLLSIKKTPRSCLLATSKSYKRKARQKVHSSKQREKEDYHTFEYVHLFVQFSIMQNNQTNEEHFKNHYFNTI